MKPLSADEYYRAQLSNPLTTFLDEIARGKALQDEMTALLPPVPDAKIRAYTVKDRLRLNANVCQFHLPLGRDIDLAETILELLEQSYIERRPTPKIIADRKKVAAEIAAKVIAGGAPENEAVGRALIGTPGSGKTRSIIRVLQQITQVVAHDLLLHPLLLPKMVTWIRVETPANRRLSALADNIITAIGVAVGDKSILKLKKGNISFRIQTAAMLCMEFHVGMIVIDEIQHVLRKDNRPDLELLNFLVELSNRIGIPLLLIGTPQAEFVAAAAVRQARRMIGPRWEPFARDSQPWKKFCAKLLEYQFTKNVAPVAALEPTLFDLSQGLPAIAVTLFQFAQRAALLLEIQTKEPTEVTAEMLKAAFTRFMRPVAPMIDALRSGNESKIAMFQDLKVDAKEVDAMLVDRADERDMLREQKLMRIAMGVTPMRKGKSRKRRLDAN